MGTREFSGSSSGKTQTSSIPAAKLSAFFRRTALLMAIDPATWAPHPNCRTPPTHPPVGDSCARNDPILERISSVSRLTAQLAHLGGCARQSCARPAGGYHGLAVIATGLSPKPVTSWRIPGTPNLNPAHSARGSTDAPCGRSSHGCREWACSLKKTAPHTEDARRWCNSRFANRSSGTMGLGHPRSEARSRRGPREVSGEMHQHPGYVSGRRSAPQRDA